MHSTTPRMIGCNLRPGMNPGGFTKELGKTRSAWRKRAEPTLYQTSLAMLAASDAILQDRPVKTPSH